MLTGGFACRTLQTVLEKLSKLEERFEEIERLSVSLRNTTDKIDKSLSPNPIHPDSNAATDQEIEEMLN